MPARTALLTLGLYDAGHAVPLAPRGSLCWPSRIPVGPARCLCRPGRKDCYAARQSPLRSGTAGFHPICWRRSAASRAAGAIRSPAIGIHGRGPWMSRVRVPSTIPRLRRSRRSRQRKHAACGRSTSVAHRSIYCTIRMRSPRWTSRLIRRPTPIMRPNSLKSCMANTGDWNKAAAAYHSATPEIGAEYQRKVLAVWPEETRLAGTFSPSASPLSRSWGATLTSCFIRQRPSVARPDIGHGRRSENDHATGATWRNRARGAQPGRLSVGADRAGVPTAGAENRAVINNSGAVPGHAPRCRTESGSC